MTHISAIIRRLNWLADDVGDIEYRIGMLTADIEYISKKYIPHFERDNNAKEDIANGKQLLLRDFA